MAALPLHREVALLMVVWLLSVCLPDAALAECCHNSQLRLRTRDFSNEHLTMFSAWTRQPSEDMCADGRLNMDAYCGRGPCNMFGCNCDDGCVAGRSFEVSTIGNRFKKLYFYCSASVPADLGGDIRALVENRDCSCVKGMNDDKYTEYVMPDPPVVEGPEQDASDPLHCDRGMVYCEVEVRSIKSFTVTEWLTIGGGMSVAKVPVDFAASRTTEWSEATSTEGGFHCTAEGGANGDYTWLRIKPKYYKLTVVTHEPRLVDNRNYCSIKHVYVPKVKPDGSIAGDRRCAFKEN